MRTLDRKPGTYTHVKLDPLITGWKFDELKKKLETLKKVSQPKASNEVARLAEMGDFSENAAYQMAKGRLRGINNTIARLENQINHAVIIKTQDQKDTIEIGGMDNPIIIGADSLGEKGKKAEDVGKDAASSLIKEVDSRCAVDKYLGDMLLPYMAVVGGKIKVSGITNHTLSNIYAIELFFGKMFEIYLYYLLFLDHKVRSHKIPFP